MIITVKVKNPILPMCRPTCWPTRESTHHQRISQHTTDALADSPLTRTYHTYFLVVVKFSVEEVFLKVNVQLNEVNLSFQS